MGKSERLMRQFDKAFELEDESSLRPGEYEMRQFNKAFREKAASYLHPFSGLRLTTAESARRLETTRTLVALQEDRPLRAVISSGKERPVRGRLTVAAVTIAVVIALGLILQPEIKFVDPPAETSRQFRNAVKPPDDRYFAESYINNRLPVRP